MIFGLYKNYTTEDFVQDNHFRKIVKDSSKAGSMLEKFILRLPDKDFEMSQSILIIKELGAKKFHNSTNQKIQSWNQVVWKQNRKKLLVVSTYAASFLFLALVSILSLQLLVKKSDFNNLPSTDALLTGEQTLILVNGQRYYISQRVSKIDYNASGESILVNDSVKIQIHDLQKSYNQIIVPYGNSSQVRLSDGTTVWANSGSKLITYPGIKGKSRKIYLEGEAYLEVTRNKKPFYVMTDAFQIKVTGTRLNVHAIKGEKIYSVVLLEGKVFLSLNDQRSHKDIELNPEQQGSLNIVDGNFTIEEVRNAENFVSWVNGCMIFENEDIKNVFRRISHFYNIPIVFDSSRIHNKIYGKVILKDNLEDILDGLASISNTIYHKKGHTYFFTRKHLNKGRNNSAN